MNHSVKYLIKTSSEAGCAHFDTLAQRNKFIEMIRRSEGLELLSKKDMTFAELDSLVKFNYRDDLYALVNYYDYKHASECVYALYNKDKKSTRQIGSMLVVSPQAITAWMDRWEFPRRPRYTQKIAS